MKREDVKNILLYYKSIPEMIKLEKQEQERLEDEYYNALRRPGTGSGSHGSAVGRPTESLAIRAAEHGAAGAVKNAKIRIINLEMDRKLIGDCISALNDKYRKIILWKVIRGDSWTRIAVCTSTPESTLRYWYDQALERLGEALEEDVTMVDELIGRASRAR